MLQSHGNKKYDQNNNMGKNLAATIISQPSNKKALSTAKVRLDIINNNHTVGCTTE